MVLEVLEVVLKVPEVFLEVFLNCLCTVFVCVGPEWSLFTTTNP